MASSGNRCAGIGILALVLATGAVAHAAEPGGRSRDDTARADSFDWIAHTQETLDTLKGLLHLDAGQNAAWDTWSGGVLQDAHRQLAHTPPQERPPAPSAGLDGETTPAQMARGIARLRAGLERMQAHLLELQAAQTRTQTFYDALDVKQKTVFDLYWHEVRHRVSGHDAQWDPHAAFGGPDGMNGRHAMGWMRGNADDGGAMMRRGSECADDGRMP